MSSTCLRGGMVIPLDGSRTLFDPGAIVFSDGVLDFVGLDQNLPPLPPDTHVIDCHGKIILPGLVNTHTHTGMSYFRNLLEDLPSDEWFRDELVAEGYMDADDIYNAALLGACEMLRQGITTIADRYHHMTVIVPALERAGIRAIVAPSLVDHQAEQRKHEALELLEQYGARGSGLIHVGLGPVSPDRCSTGLLQWTRQQADHNGVLIFIHVAQSRQELDEVRRRGYNGAVRYLDALGFLGPDVIAAHCMYVDQEEIEILARRGMRVAHCPASNAKIEGVVAPIPALERAGVLTSLGTDCAASNNRMDLFDEMRTAGLLHKAAGHDPTILPSIRLLEMATLTAAKCLGLDHAVGSLQPGKQADLITLNRKAIHLLPWNDPFAGLVYSARGLDVEDVWVAGVPRVRNSELLLDELPEVIERAARWTRPSFNPKSIKQEE